MFFVYSLDVVFEMLVLLILEPLGVEFELPGGPPDPQNLDFAKEFATF